MQLRAKLIPPLLAIAFALASAAPAAAGAVRGTVRTPALARENAGANAYPGRASSLPGVRATARGAVTDAVLSVDRIPAASESALAAHAVRPRLEQRGQAFVPRVLPVAAGSVVDFPNLDPVFHNVFSVSPARRFDLGKYPRGESRAVTFPRTGLVNVYCDLHADMAAYVLVLPNHAFVQPRADGTYLLPDLPAGRYVIRWWHPDLPGGSREVEVPATGAAIVDVGF